MNLGNLGTRALRVLGRVLAIGVSWACLCLAIWLIAGTIIEIADSDSFDPGELWAWIRMDGPMMLLAGIAIGIAPSVGGNRQRRAGELPLRRVVACGFLGCALVQIPYLDQGEFPLEDNIEMALGVCVLGAGVTLVWGCVAHIWVRWRAALEPRS